MQLLAGKVYRAYSEFVNDQSLVVTGGSVNFFLSNNQGNPATLIANKEFFLLPEVDNPYTNEAAVQWPYYDYIAFTVVSGSPLVIAPDNAFVYVGEQQTFTGSTAVMVNGLCRLSDQATSSLTTRIVNLENTIYEYEIFEVLGSGTTGSVTIPEGASILLNVYPNAGDCLLSRCDAYGRPINDPPVSAVGTPIVGTLDAYGAWTLSGVPSSYPICLIYQVSILGKDAHNIPLSTVLDGNVVSGLRSPTAPNQFAIAAITGLQTALDDKVDESDRQALADDMQDFTGFAVPEEVVVTPNWNRTVTLTGTLRAYYRGIQFTIPAGTISPSHPSTTDHIYWLYWDGTQLVWSDGFCGFDKLLICTAYYGATVKYYTVETHGLMQHSVHGALHNNIGTGRKSGGESSGWTPNSTTATDRRPDIAETVLMDEDLEITLPALTTKAYSQKRMVGTTRTYSLAATDIIKLSGANPYYNPITAGSGSDVLMPNNSVATVWLYGVPVTNEETSTQYRFTFVAPQSITQATGSSAGAINTAVATEALKTTQSLVLGDAAVVAAEYVCFRKFIVAYTGSNWKIMAEYAVEGNQKAQVAVSQYGLTQVTSNPTYFSGDGTPASPLDFIGDVGVPDHNDTTSKQGGAAGEYYHATAAERDQWYSLAAEYTVPATDTSTVTFANLPAGDYKFEISVANKVLADACNCIMIWKKGATELRQQFSQSRVTNSVSSVVVTTSANSIPVPLNSNLYALYAALPTWITGNLHKWRNRQCECNFASQGTLRYSDGTSPIYCQVLKGYSTVYTAYSEDADPDFMDTLVFYTGNAAMCFATGSTFKIYKRIV